MLVVAGLALIALVLAFAICGAVSVPFIALGVRAAKRAPEKRRRRALVWATASAAACAFVLALAGLVWGAGVGDESAGEIAGVLFLMGAAIGATMGAGITFAAVVRRARV